MVCSNDQRKGRSRLFVPHFAERCIEGARGQAENVTDILTVARRVILDGRRMRCAKEGEPASSLDLKSSGVTGYMLDANVARELGVPPSAP